MAITLTIIAAAVVMAAIYFVVNVAGTRMTGEQIDDDPDVRRHVDPDKQNDDFPLDADF